MILIMLLMSMFISANGEMLDATPVEGEPSSLETSIEVVNEVGTQITTGPVLMVTDYAVIEGETVPGSNFVLEMNIANLSETASAYNVLATLTIENVSVSLQEGYTNQAYFHEIPPMQSVKVRFPLEVYIYCAEENMILSMTMTCYDAAAVHYDFQTMMTPNIDVSRTLKVGSLTVPQFVHRNSSMIISATLVNIEPVTLDHVRMHVITQYGEQVTEVGRILSGESKTPDVIYRFPEQKTEEVKVYFTYENLSGHEYHTEIETFEVIVYDPAVQEDFVKTNSVNLKQILNNLTAKTELPGANILLPIPTVTWIVIGVIGYAVVVCLALRNKRR